MVILYSIGIFLYGIAIRIASLFQSKAKAWVKGRKGLFEKLQSQIPLKKKWIWFHVSSLGEFEQGRPLIEKVRSESPETGILLTFFSPSGYLIRKNYDKADIVTYMPLDTKINAKRFVDIVRPVAAIFIKYDIWYHHLIALERTNIPTFLVSANLREGQVYFRTYGKFLRTRLERLQRIFTQTKESTEYLQRIGFKNITHAGDTRVDRVLAIASSPKDFSWLRSQFGNQKILVAGSTWPADEQRLIPAIKASGLALIIAPHEIHEERLKELEAQLPGARRISELRKHTVQPEQPEQPEQPGQPGQPGQPVQPEQPERPVQPDPGQRLVSLWLKPEILKYVIVDTIGDLAHLYAIGDLAYVGGGFGKGIHNILEPAAHLKPLMFGPHYEGFPEAVVFVRSGAARSILTTGDVIEAIEQFMRGDEGKRVGDLIVQYLDEQKGATERVYNSPPDPLSLLLK